MRRSILLAIVVILALVFAGTVTAATVLTNGGFETGDLTGWTCASCTAETNAPFAGSYFARRAADNTLSQSATVDGNCEQWRVVYGARQYSAGTHTASAGFSSCGLVSSDYTPALPGESWSTHYLTVDSCSGDTSLSVEFSGSGATDLDEVAVYCLVSNDSPASYVGTTASGRDYAVQPIASFGEIALFLAVAAVAAIAAINTGVTIIMYRHTRR